MKKNQTPEEKFIDHLIDLLKMPGVPLTLAYLNHLSLEDVNGQKELIFLPGCIIEPELRPLFKKLWEECNGKNFG